MRALLFVIGLLLVAAGVIIGVMSFLSPGEVILGLNLGLAATLLIGGFIVIALSAVVGAVDNLAGSLMPVIDNQMARESVRTEPSVSTDSVTAAATGAATAAVGAVAVTAANASETVTETASETMQTASDTIQAVSNAPEPEEFTSQPTAETAPVSAAEAEDVGAHAAESAVDEVRKSLGIDDVQLDRTGDGSPVVSERVAEAVEEVVSDAPESTSVAARIGEITAGVKAAASSAGDKFEFDEVSEAVGDKIAETASGAGQAAGDQVEAVAEAVADAPEAMAEAAQDAVETVAETSQTVTEGAADLVEDVVEEIPDVTDVAEVIQESEVVEEVKAAVESVMPDEADLSETEVPAVVEEASVEVEDTAEAEEQEKPEQQEKADEQPTTDAHEEGALYVVEETTVRERPARLLSDGTVEAETDAGWMRFENMDHLNEYLDAMSS